jgi:WASH complex subunit strumpellin
MDLLNPQNLCGQHLLRIVSRGSAIIAELFRLSDNIPEVFLDPSKDGDSNNLRYQAVLFDFQYFRDPEEFEKLINSDTDLLELDQEFQGTYEG